VTTPAIPTLRQRCGPAVALPVAGVTAPFDAVVLPARGGAATAAVPPRHVLKAREQAAAPAGREFRGTAGGFRAVVDVRRRGGAPGQVVEGTAAIAASIETALDDIPAYRATAVTDGAAALARGAEGRVALPLPGPDLPGLDGFAIHDLLRARPGTASVPIPFMPAGAHDGACARRAVRGHSTRPCDPDDLPLRVAPALTGDGGAVGDGRPVPGAR